MCRKSKMWKSHGFNFFNKSWKKMQAVERKSKLVSTTNFNLRRPPCEMMVGVADEELVNDQVINKFRVKFVQIKLHN